MTYRKTLSTALISASALALPAVASAYCGPVQQGSATVSCEQGVQVMRQHQPRRAAISPTQAAQLELSAQRLRLQALQADRAYQLQQDRIDLDYARLSQQDYLLRDQNSPLRNFGYGYGGFGGGYGLGGGFVEVAPGQFRSQQRSVSDRAIGLARQQSARNAAERQARQGAQRAVRGYGGGSAGRAAAPAPKGKTMGGKPMGRKTH